jgi:hypothetical protein
MANDEIRIVFLPPAYSRPYMVVETAVEPTTGIEPVDLFLTKEALYRLSYVGESPPSNLRCASDMS